MKKFFDYFIPTIIGLMFVILICCLKNVFKLETSKEVFHVLVDAFFAVGCVIFAWELLPIQPIKVPLQC